MTDIVATTFRLYNDRHLFVPSFDAQYTEKETGVLWVINAGGTRSYFIRIGKDLDKDFKTQSADSHFMATRLLTSLFLSGHGFFRAEAMGRLFIEMISFEEPLNIHTHLDLWNVDGSITKDEEALKELEDWYPFICENMLFRRAAEDAYAALQNPVEAVFFVYRGMEWLLRAGNIGWKELADDIGVSFSDIKKFKKMANSDLGQRHGIVTGRKLRATTEEYGSLVADFLYGICKVRQRVDPNYKIISNQRAAQIVLKAIPIVPYP